MADIAITPTTLTLNTLSANLIANGEGGTSVTAGNVAVITVNPTDRLVLSFYAASAATATVQAGYNPPAVRQALGNAGPLTVPSGNVVLLFIEGARFMQDNGTIRIAIGGNTTVVGAHILPKTG